MMPQNQKFHGRIYMINRNRIQCRIKVRRWLKCTLIISKSTNHDTSFPKQYESSIKKFEWIHVFNDTGCLPSTVSIVVNICQFILRDTIPNATFRTWQHMIPFVNAKNIKIIIPLTILTKIYQSLEILLSVIYWSLTSSNTRLTNLKESKRVSVISATGTPKYPKGSINQRIANASCSGAVVVRQRLALWKTFEKYQTKSWDPFRQLKAN